jgi:hypothetical protein
MTAGMAPREWVALAVVFVGGAILGVAVLYGVISWAHAAQHAYTHTPCLASVCEPMDAGWGQE